MDAVDFEQNPSDPVTIKHCMDFLLKCVKDKPAEIDIDAYKGSLFDGMGYNNH